MSSVKLQSCDGVIFTVDAATVKQMVTIQTMIDQEDEDSDEVTPVPTVEAQVLEKIIQWTEFHKIDNEKTEKIAWYIQYFNVDLKKKFEIVIAADYLEVQSLLKESCRNILINNDWENIKDTASSFHGQTIVPLLEKYEREHGHEVIVTIVNEKYLKYFNTKTETWTHLTDIPVEYSRPPVEKNDFRFSSRFPWSSVRYVEGNIYLVGGYSLDRRIIVYNCLTNTWRKMPNLQRERCGHSVCTLDNKIFVLGGYDTTCEMLDLTDDDPQWRYIAHMNNSLAIGSVVIGRKIYVLGRGSSVWVYDVDQDQWNFENSIVPSRSFGEVVAGEGVAALDNKIYVTGGYDGKDGYYSSVYCYDPDTNRWSKMANMNIGRRSHSLVSVHGKMYAIGGFGYEDDDYVDSIEVYDPDSNRWTLLQHMLDGKVYGARDCVIKEYILK